MYSTKTAYLLWLASFFGVSGLHRLYMGKIGTGILFLMTWGLGGLGTIYDGITMPDQ
ncbi:MAG TPA: TM2 domain-containing protein, partial [Spirochaetia bacterium]|nr:TM2 domain-containing protein [Spirochaetia bacterium]